jgi:phosphatidylglycerophosphate synthase
MRTTSRGLASAANGITALRLALACGLWFLAPADAWTIVSLATVSASLDAVDGPIARRSGRVSAFGARFDMETDAFLIVTLSMLVWRLDKAGPWVLLSGLLRYAFVAASWVWPWLANDLPPSWRRKVVCVVQIAGLIVALAPVVSPTVSAPLSAAALTLLAWSFWVDVAWLRRSARRS